MRHGCRDSGDTDKRNGWALRNRVANYTQVDRLPKRLQRMVAQTRSMTIVTTNSEAEALLLEAQLIKRFRPPYNVLLRDDKASPLSFCGRIMIFLGSRNIVARANIRGAIMDLSPARGR